MKKLIKPVRNASAVFVLASLAACGGGGGGGGATAPVPGNNSPVTPTTPPVVTQPADGMGEAGHLAGTVLLDASLPKGLLISQDLGLAVGMSNEGKSLAVWQVPESAEVSEQKVGWAQSNSAGVFAPSSVLSQAGKGVGRVRLTMRMNDSGSAVVGLANVVGANVLPRVARFIEGSGWDSAIYDPLRGYGSARATTAGTSWDLSILSDNSFTFSGASSNSVAVVQTRAAGQQIVALETLFDPSGKVSEYSYFAPKGTGGGLLYTGKSVVSTFNGQLYNTTDISVRLADIQGGMFAPIPVGNFGPLCDLPNYEGPMVAATTVKSEGVLALNAMEQDGCATSNLQLVRVYTLSSMRVENRRLNSAGTFLPVAPVVTVDKDGNALAVWMETDGQRSTATSGNTTRLMWSQSMYGGTWSTPQSLASNSTGTGDDFMGRFPISLAMNASGQAVIALRRGVENPVMSVRRFDFKSGWADWKAVANKQNLSAPAVAINASGQAVVVYAGMDTPRVNGKAGTSSTGLNEMRMYSLRF